MNLHRSFAIVAVLAAVAVFAAPAQAQQASAYYNPFDSNSDFPSTWYMDGYPFPFAIDGSPVGGHDSSASLNWNNGTDIDGDYPYGYWYTDSFDMSDYTDPVLSFWCRWDMDPDPYWHYREIYMYETITYNFYYYAVFNSDIDCGDADTWHQHFIPVEGGLETMPVVIQFYTYSNDYYGGGNYQGWFMDDFAILVPDVTPPDAIADLAASNATETEIQLDWTSPFDDDISGVAASFDLRYSTTPITDANFSSATQVDGEPAPDVEGTAHSVVVSGLTQDTGYYFAVQTTDIAGNVSLISNVAPLATLAPPPPPPAPAPKSSGPEEVKVDEDILPCSAGTSGAPTGVLALAGLMVLAFAVRRK